MTYRIKSATASNGHDSGVMMPAKLAHRLLNLVNIGGILRRLASSRLSLGTVISPEERGRMAHANFVKAHMGQRHLDALRRRRKRSKKHGFYGRSANKKGKRHSMFPGR